MKTKKSFQELIKSDTPVLVDFYADWCAPCKMMPPILASVKQAFGPHLNIIKIDIEKNMRVAATYQVRTIPTLLLFHQGQEKWRHNGVIQASQLEEMIRKKV